METVSGEVLPAAPKHRELSAEEADALAASAFAIEQRIKAAVGGVHQSSWDLAEAFYDFHEAGGWRPLGYERIEDFLAQPEISVKRAMFFRMVQVWRDLVVVRGVYPNRLRELDLTKVALVRPKIMSGDVDIDRALSDAATLGSRDLREQYRKDPNAKLAAEDEPERVQCPKCGSWIEADALDG